jgi:hypothetical protein
MTNHMFNMYFWAFALGMAVDCGLSHELSQPSHASSPRYEPPPIPRPSISQDSVPKTKDEPPSASMFTPAESDMIVRAAKLSSKTNRQWVHDAVIEDARKGSLPKNGEDLSRPIVKE